MNREEWLTTVALGVGALFVRRWTLKPYRITCGWPCIGARGSRVGECHASESSSDGTFEIFISPVLAEPLTVAGVVAHELCHVAAGIRAKHGKGFKQVAHSIGLTKGKMTKASPGEALNVCLAEILGGLPSYPHAALVGRPARKAARSVTSLLCPECGCKCTMALRWLTEAGLPTCGCGYVMEEVTGEGE